MSKPIIIVVFGSLLLLCVTAQVVSLKQPNLKSDLTQKLTTAG